MSFSKCASCIHNQALDDHDYEEGHLCGWSKIVNCDVCVVKGPMFVEQVLQRPGISRDLSF